MKLVIYIIIALALGALASHFLMADPGYVVINFRGYIIEMSVPGMVLILGLLAISVWVIIKLLRAPRKLGEAAATFRDKRAGQRFTRGLIEIAEGNYAKGERMLTRGANKASAPLLNYLAAARAAQLQNHDERRDNWLKLAYENEPEASSAILLTQAELQIAHKQYELALATLKQLDEQESGKGQAVVLLAKLYHKLKDYEQLAPLLPRLNKLAKPDKATREVWAVDVLEQQLTEAGKAGGEVQVAWAGVNKPLKKNVRLRTAYIVALVKIGNNVLAETELRRLLKTTWHPRLVGLYGEIKTDEPAKQLQRVEAWLSKHQNDATLLLSAGRLCLATKLWGKARSYLESSIAVQPSPAAYSAYGELLNQLGESDAAANAYRNGLSMIADDTLALPRLEIEE